MIDPADPRPPYRQLAEGLRKRITAGDLRPGDRLPSERQLRDEYGITHVTVRRAIGLLRAEGLVDVQHGRGTFVRPKRPWTAISATYLAQRPEEQADPWLTETARQGRTGTQELTHVGVVPAPPDVATRLGIPDGDPVVVRRRTMVLDGEPTQLVDSYYRADVFGKTELASPRKLRGGASAALRRLGYQLDRFRDDLVVRMPTPDEARSLDLGPGIPVARLLRTTYAADGHPVEVTELILAGDRHLLSYELPISP